ncbi:polysaccharide deacetylase family protein [candidate division KSB1 bacterium]|nr:polysaccharide deacetylase family protein [candidate division KSB1 bacterium]
MIGTITHFTETDAVALTFDDGPHPEYTPQLLDILERHQARVTFFPVGEFAQKYPELIRRAAESGHAIGNHSWNHAAFPFVTGREQRAQIRACAQTLAPYEHRPYGQRLFRPPYGYQNVFSRLNALWLGYQVVAWSVHAEDWFDRDAEWMTEQLLQKIQPGSIVLLHDGVFDGLQERFFDRGQTIQAVAMLLERLAGRFRFLTIPELLREGRPQRENWYIPLANDKVKRMRMTLNRMKRPEGEVRVYAK